MLKRNPRLSSFISFALISTQIAFPAISLAATNTSSTAIPDTFEWSDSLTSVAQSMSTSHGHALKDTAKTAATTAGADSVEAWLNHYGTARVQLSVDENGNWGDSSLDYLLPIYDNKKAILFTQLGMRAPDGRFTTNIGLGVRTFYIDNWMLGTNVFFDHDYKGDNRRVGVGAEAWTNNFKLSANGYFGTSDWHTSRDFADYDEKPADGFDIRAEGYLPAYPQLGASVMYEKYYGDNVALFDKDDLQKNPSAVTVGVSYTPIPLVTAGVDYKRGQDSKNEVHFSLNFRYVPGESWQSQTSGDQVALRRSLAGSRYDLVERNNEIILQYKKKTASADVLADMTLTPLQNNSPADGMTVNQVTVHAVTSSGQPAKNTAIAWSTTGSAKLSASSSVTDENGNATLSVTDTVSEAIQVTATSGSLVRTSSLSFATADTALTLELTKNNSQANGSGQNKGSVTVKDSNGNSLSGVSVTWKVNNGARIVDSQSTTDAHGQATAAFTSTTAGTVDLTASTKDHSQTVHSTFVGQQTNALKVSLSTNDRPADGKTANVAQAIVTDASGNPAKGVSVTWSTTGTATAATATTSTTDGNGRATFSFVDKTMETVVVTAQAENLTDRSSATFTASDRKVATVTLTATGSGSQADPVRYSAVTKNAEGVVVPAVGVIWSGGIIENANITCNTGDSSTNVRGKATKTCYNTSASAIKDVTMNVVIPVQYVVHPMKNVSDGVTMDYAPAK